MIAFACEHCGKHLKVSEERAGKKGKCPSCGQRLRIPQAVAVAGAAGGPPASSGARLDRSAPQPPAPDGTSGSRRSRRSSPDDYSFLAPPQGPDELGRLGHYRILKVLGAGGMGVVFEAEDTQLLRRVALKAMKPSVVNPANCERFLYEARATAKIEHDHIVTIYQVGEDCGVPFLAMKLLQGRSLEDRLREEGGWLPVPEVLRIGREIAEGLEAAHAKGLIHRDIKPANIWLEGEKQRVKIVDFGLARAAEVDLNLTQEGLVMGTPAYMAPEQADDKPLDFRCDLFSLGGVLYRAVTGQFPFKGKDSMAIMMALATKDPDPPREIDPAVPAALSDLIMQLLAKDPDDRPASARAVRDALERIEREYSSAKSAEPVPSVPPDDDDLKPIEEDDVPASGDSEDVVVLEVDDSAEEVVEAEEVEVVVEQAPRRRSRSGSRPKRRAEVQEEEGSERVVIIIGLIAAGLIILLLAFIFVRRALRTEEPVSELLPASVPRATQSDSVRRAIPSWSHQAACLRAAARRKTCSIC